jgi:hypothetical protein
MSRSPWLSPKRWVILATAALVVYFAFTAASNTLQAIQIGQDESRLRQEVTGFEQRYDQLTALRDYLKSDEYIEWVARRELGLAPRRIGLHRDIGGHTDASGGTATALVGGTQRRLAAFGLSVAR